MFLQASVSHSVHGGGKGVGISGARSLPGVLVIPTELGILVGGLTGEGIPDTRYLPPGSDI